jgi:hypothetical protein
LTQFIDWSASTHNVLYVAGNRDDTVPAGIGQPSDNFNGITVAASARESGGKWRRVAAFNDFSLATPAGRTLVGILAPGAGIDVADVGGPIPPPTEDGNSYAVPHVTGTVALLQEHGESRIPGPGWNENARQHEVMKAVLLNSADKIEDRWPILGHGKNSVEER